MEGGLLFTDHQTPATDWTDQSLESYMGDGPKWIEPILRFASRFHALKEDRIARLLVHDAVRHKLIKTVKLSPWLQRGTSETLTTQNHFLMHQYSPSGYWPFAVSNASLTTVDIDMNATAPTPLTVSASLSPGSEPYDVSYSPSGDRVAYLRVHDNQPRPWLPPPLQRWWDRFFPPAERPPYKITLWVSGLRGKGAHEVGSVPHNNMFSTDTDWEYPNSIQWLPDGKTLSFLCGKSLWTVPSD